MIHPVVSDRGITHFFKATQKYNREGGRKNKRTNRDLGQLQAQEREFCDTLHSPCICRLSPACILRETSTKAIRNATHLWLSSLTASFCWPSFPWTAISLWLVSSALRCRLHLSVFLCQLLSVFYRTSLSSSTSGLAGVLAVRPFVLVSRQTQRMAT